MPTRRGRGNELRCFCQHRPLLATYGVDERGRLYVHVKVYKGSRIYGEVLSYGGTKVRCRDCFRWHTVVIRPHGEPELRQTNRVPDGVETR
jgi:hypothetical protein